MKLADPYAANANINSSRGRSTALILLSGIGLGCAILLVLSMSSLLPRGFDDKLAALQRESALATTQPSIVVETTTTQPSAYTQTELSNKLTESELKLILTSAFGQLPALAESPYPISKELIDLGRMLYYDVRLSSDGTKSCNSCHDLQTYGVDGEARSTGVSGQPVERNTPTVYNAALHISQFWDGRSPDVEDQATKPIMAIGEMGMINEQELKRNISAIPGYISLFAAAFPTDSEPISLKNTGIAIGTFERGLLTPSRFDRFLAGDPTQLNEQEQKGLATFISMRCITCHSGPTLGGLSYKRLGLKEPYSSTDLGRYEVTHLDEDKYVFKVPGLRNVVETGPYLHDGSIATLEEMVRLMARYQLGTPVNDEQVNDIVAFLRSLTGDVPTDYIAMPELPPSAPK